MVKKGKKKNGFIKHFCCWQNHFKIMKFGFLALFKAKMIKDPKLIISNDYQQFWVNFEWFLALFHISDENWLLS